MSWYGYNACNMYSERIVYSDKHIIKKDMTIVKIHNGENKCMSGYIYMAFILCDRGLCMQTFSSDTQRHVAADIKKCVMF